MRCYICKKEVKLVDTDETHDCEVCGYHYLDKCPECETLYDIAGHNPMVLTEDGWDYYSEEVD